MFHNLKVTLWAVSLSLLLNFSHATASDLVDQSFLDFVRFVSNTSKQNIVIDESVDSRFSVVLPSNYSSQDSMQLFFAVLSKHRLEPIIIGSTLYVQKSSDNKKFYTFDLFFELPSTISKAITDNYPDIKVSSVQKTIVLKSDLKQYGEIKSLVEALDRPRPQRKLKIIMISYNDTDIEEFGSKLDFKHSSASNIGITSLINSLKLGNTISFSNQLVDFSLSFSALRSAGVAQVHLDNIITLSDGKDSSVKSTKTIPILLQENNVDANRQVSTNSFKYRDVGTEISLSNVTVTDDTLYFQATFIHEQLINETITPTTFKREVINYLRIPAGSSMLISGIKSLDDNSRKAKIPFLGDIPFLGSLFSYETGNRQTQTFAIYLENIGFDDKNTSMEYAR